MTGPTTAPTPPTLADICCFLQTWPAAEVVESDGWLLQATGGFTKRANSALALRADADLRVVEEFYRDRGLPPSVVDYRSRRGAVQQQLAAEGWRALPDDPVMAATVQVVLSAAEPARSRVELLAAPSPHWFAGWFGSGRADSTVARGLVTGSPLQRFAVIADAQAAPVAIGRVAVVGEWAGINCMWTRPDSRKQGHAGVDPAGAGHSRPGLRRSQASAQRRTRQRGGHLHLSAGGLRHRRSLSLLVRVG